jgi:hypothetical protein
MKRSATPFIESAVGKLVNGNGEAQTVSVSTESRVAGCAGIATRSRQQHRASDGTEWLCVGTWLVLAAQQACCEPCSDVTPSAQHGIGDKIVETAKNNQKYCGRKAFMTAILRLV